MARKRRGADDLEAGRSEHYVDAELYDHEYRRRRRDVHFYRRIAGRLLGGPGRVLDLACGTGRVTTALLREGHTVVGIDRSATMLQRADARITRRSRALRDRCHLVRADMRQFALSARFPLVVMAFNSFEHLYQDSDIDRCLASIRDHLAPGGSFVFDIQNPDLAWLLRDPRKRWARTRFRHPRTGQSMIYSTNHVYDPISQIVNIRLYYQTVVRNTVVGEQVVALSQRKFFPAEMVAVLAARGFEVIERYGDFDDLPLTEECENQVLVCRPQ